MYMTRFKVGDFVEVTCDERTRCKHWGSLSTKLVQFLEKTIRMKLVPVLHILKMFTENYSLGVHRTYFIKEMINYEESDP